MQTRLDTLLGVSVLQVIVVSVQAVWIRQEWYMCQVRYHYRSTTESAPVYASPTCGTSLSPMPASTLEAARVVETSKENSNAAPAVVSNPSLSRSCSRMSFVRDDKARPSATKLSPSFPSYVGFN